MGKTNSVLFAVFLAVALCLSACGGGGGDSDMATAGQTGELSVGLTDATTNDFQAVYITVKEVSVSQAVPNDSSDEFDGDWIVVAEPNITCNLLELVNGVIEQLGITEIEAGRYSQMRLLLGDTPEEGEGVVNINDEPHPFANYVVYGNSETFVPGDSETYEIYELKVPSGYETGIKIVGGFDVEADSITDLVLDFNVVRSIVHAGESGQWLLKPTIKALDLDGSAVVSGLVYYTSDTDVPEDFPIEGAIISAQSSTGGIGDDIVTAATISDEAGEYQLLLEPGTYMVVAIAEGYQTASTDITVEADTSTQQDFQMVPVESETGTIYGAVNILNGIDDQFVTIDVLDENDLVVDTISVANGGTYWFDLPPGTYSLVAVFMSNGEEMTLEAYDSFEVEDGTVEEFDILFENVDEADEETAGERPEKVTICHKGKTITISYSALQAHLNHGDTEGTCEEVNGEIESPEGEEEGEGETEGEGEEGEGEGEEIDEGEDEPESEVEEEQEKIAVCHKGKTIYIATPALDAHLAHGDTVGVCGE